MNEVSLKQVVDSDGGRYELGRRIGEGGQGAVYLCKSNPRIAVKVIRNPNQQHASAMRNQIASVKRMDLKNLPIARPVATLARPQVGYVMKLATGMAAISTLMDPPRGESSIVDWYMSTGGLGRRLRLLARLARTLAEIHGMGLAYGDPSPGNVLISETPDSDDVFLIDCDNLRYSTNPEEVKLYTPGYGAPELVSSRSGFNTLTDAHAFAVIAFRLLCLTHPLIGDSVANGDPALEKAAYRGEVPWIEHASDDSNRSSLGVDRSMVLSPNLRRLFSATFEDGLADSTKRPGMAHWVEVLRTAAAVTISCSGCEWSYYCASKACPICDQDRPDVLFGRIGLWDPASGESGAICTDPSGRPMWVDAAVGTNRKTLCISASQLGIGDSEDSVLAVALKRDRRITLSNPSGNEKILVTGSRSGAAPRPIAENSESFRLSRPDSILFVHMGDLSGSHRVVCLEIRQEEGQ